MNTGNKIVLTLVERNLTTDVLTGNSKPNLPGDPDYIPVGPSDDCPVEAGLDCPVLKAGRFGPDGIHYEFSLPPSVISNTAVVKMQVLLYAPGPSLTATHTYTDFDPNLFSNEFTGLSLGTTYTLEVVYKNNVDAVLHTCSALYTQVPGEEDVILWNTSTNYDMTGVDAHITITSGTFPLVADSLSLIARGIMTPFTGTLDVSVSGTGSAFLVLRVNGVDTETIPVPTDTVGTLNFSSRTYVSGESIVITLKN